MMILILSMINAYIIFIIIKPIDRYSVLSPNTVTIRNALPLCPYTVATGCISDDFSQDKVGSASLMNYIEYNACALIFANLKGLPISRFGNDNDEKRVITVTL